MIELIYLCNNMSKLISLGRWERKLRNPVDQYVVDTANLIIRNPGIKSDDPDTKRPIFDTEIHNIRIQDLRKAAECHRQARRNIQQILKPGIRLLDICTGIEDDIVKIFGRNDMTAGIAFPTGISLNNIICHDTANPNDQRILGKDDICKIDFGTHVNGWIVDSAFSVTFNPEYEPLLEAAKESMWAGIRMAGPDVLINEVSNEIREVIESYELTIGGKIFPVLAVGDLGGHNIKQYVVHGEKLVLCSPCMEKGYRDARMESGEQYAIETYPSTGKGRAMQNKNLEMNHYGLTENHTFKSKLKTTRQVYSWIKSKRSTLPFCPRWLEKDFGGKYKFALREMVQKQILIGYPPLEDVRGSLTAQFEHTFLIGDYGKEIISHGDDY